MNKFFKKLAESLIIPILIVLGLPYIIYLTIEGIWEDIDIDHEIEELYEKEQRILAAAIKSNTKNRKNRSL